MARDDMFNWLLRKNKSQQAEPQPQPVEPVEKTAPTPSETTTAAVPAAKPVEPEKPVEVGPEPAVAEEAAPVAVEAPAPAPMAAETPAPEPVATPAPVVAEAPAPTPSVADEPSAVPQVRPAYAGISTTKRLLVLDRSSDEVLPSAGAAVVEHAGKHKREGVLVGVRADGRRLLAKVGPAGGIRAYTLRYDGAYRLEGAIDARAPVLTLAHEA